MRNSPVIGPSADDVDQNVPQVVGLDDLGVRLAFGLVAWTLFIWVGRIRNVVTDDELVGWALVARVGLAVSFVVVALVAAALLVHGIRTRVTSARTSLLGAPRTAVGILAVYGIVVWGIRGTDIFLGSHALAFKAVHTVLAVVTIALGIAVIQRFVRVGRSASE